jgi:hypothetical protein
LFFSDEGVLLWPDEPDVEDDEPLFIELAPDGGLLLLP